MSGPRRSHTAVPHAYFITFHCYGTRLHGDVRGSVDRHTATYGAPPLDHQPGRQAYERDLLRDAPTMLQQQHRRIVTEAIRATCEHRGWELSTLYVGASHVHVVLACEGTPERALTALKARATFHLRQAGLVSESARVWSRHGSTRYLWDQAQLDAAVTHVNEWQDGERFEGE